MPLKDLIAVVREKRLEGIIAKRADSTYRTEKRSGDWLKWRANQRQEFVIGGYVPSGRSFDSILVGYFDSRQLLCARQVRARVPCRRAFGLFSHFAALQIGPLQVHESASNRAMPLCKRV